jgi:drug/metabolite transporter (DMT)-like permease
MMRSSTTFGMLIAVVAAASFGLSGALIKPVLEAGWSPAAAVTLRVLIGGSVLAPFAIVALKGRWIALWYARTRILLMAIIGVAATQLVYFAAVERIPVGIAILLEYMAPLLLVAFAWATTRRMPKVVVLVGSVVALGGLILVVSPEGSGGLDPIGIIFGASAAVGAAVYYVVAARSSEGLPAVALASAGLLIGGILLGLVGLIGIVPFDMPMVEVSVLGFMAPWWVPLLIVGIVATGIAYSTSIMASEMLGSRLASFVGLLEVVTAALYAWILLGESLSVSQFIGGALILAGIAFVRSEKSEEFSDFTIEAESIPSDDDEPILAPASAPLEPGTDTVPLRHVQSLGG